MAQTKGTGRGRAALPTLPKGTPVLGRVTTYSMPDDPIAGTKLVRSAGKHGLDVDSLPTKRTGAHIFMSACRSVETRRSGGTNGATKRVEVKVDEVLHNGAEVVYQITRLVRDPAERVIEHPKAMTLAYDKALDKIEVKELEDYDVLRGLEDAIRSDYAKHAKDIPGQKIRNYVRDQVLGLGAQNLRRKAGGLYFVPETYRVTKAGGTAHQPTEPVLEGLAGFLHDLYGDRGDFYFFPLPRMEATEEMVAKHFTINVREQTADALQRAVNRVRQGKGERGVRQDLIANLWNERRKIAGAVEDFSQIVDVEQKQITKDLRDLDKALAELQELAE